jgi:hypothetical protein
MGHGTQADTYNVLSVSPLFDGDLLAPNNTSLLVDKIEPWLDLTKCIQKSTPANHVAVEEAANDTSTTSKPECGHHAIKTSFSSICQNVKFIHPVLDSHIEKSLN